MVSYVALTGQTFTWTCDCSITLCTLLSSLLHREVSSGQHEAGRSGQQHSGQWPGGRALHPLQVWVQTQPHQPRGAWGGSGGVPFHLPLQREDVSLSVSMFVHLFVFCFDFHLSVVPNCHLEFPSTINSNYNVFVLCVRVHSSLFVCIPVCEYCVCMSSAENQKGVNAAQRCSVKTQKDSGSQWNIG